MYLSKRYEKLGIYGRLCNAFTLIMHSYISSSFHCVLGGAFITLGNLLRKTKDRGKQTTKLASLEQLERRHALARVPKVAR